jgi:PAS domain S-box-containing protein/diguanylate cyclase (GGDEF)-like protein
MLDRTELLESALDGLTDGMALVDQGGRVAFWNRTAETIAGYSAREAVGRNVAEILDAMVTGGSQHWIRETDTVCAERRGFVIQVRHKLGHTFPVFARILILRDGMGERVGSGLIFHPTERLDALPHGQSSNDMAVAQSRTELEERLCAMHEDFLDCGAPLGLIWLTVDQAHELRRTHGSRAVEAMLEKVEHSLAEGLKPAEEIGRWGDDEFLVLSHERNLAMLAAHARVLAGMARTTDFRWWGDRVSLTVSAGAAWAEQDEALSTLLERAQVAMVASMQAGGNQVTASPGSVRCSQS